MTVVEVEVFTIVLCAQTMEDQCSIHATETVKKHNIKKTVSVIYAHMKIQLQSAESKNKPKST